MKNLFSFFFFLILFFPSLSHGEEINAGFVQGIWFSSEKTFADSPTRIYVALRNNTPDDLTGTVFFSDNGSRIGSSNISALSGRLVEAWVDWKPTHGDHTISANLHNTKLHPIGENTQEANAMSTLAELTIFVDRDTDNDGVGNTTDEDDDNDTVSDLEEKVRGSDPLVPNPKLVTEKDTEETQGGKTDPVATPQSQPQSTEPLEEGLEKYIDEGIADSLLHNVTTKVVGAKASLDTYRTKRNDAYAEKIHSTLDTTATATPLGTYTQDSTVTRTQLEKQGTFLGSFVAGVASILHSIWTFVLWVASKALSHPALIQVFLLLAILYIFFKIARRIGRRPNY